VTLIAVDAAQPERQPRRQNADDEGGDQVEPEGRGSRRAAFFRVSSIRVCQPGPWPRKWVRTSGESRSVTFSLRSSAGLAGRPRGRASRITLSPTMCLPRSAISRVKRGGSSRSGSIEVVDFSLIFLRSPRTLCTDIKVIAQSFLSGRKLSGGARVPGFPWRIVAPIRYKTLDSVTLVWYFLPML